MAKPIPYDDDSEPGDEDTRDKREVILYDDEVLQLMQGWTGGQSDPLYAISSMGGANEAWVFEDAISNLDSDIRKVKKISRDKYQLGKGTFTKKEIDELHQIRDALQMALDGTDGPHEAREVNAPGRRSWQGTDHNERAYNRVHNMLVGIILDGVKGVSPELPGHEWRLIPPEKADEYIERGRKVLADFESQSAPRGNAQKWLTRKTEELRRLLSDAEAVRSGARPQKMTPDDYETLKKSLTGPRAEPNDESWSYDDDSEESKWRRGVGPKPEWLKESSAPADVLRTLQPGDMVTVESAELPKPRKLVVTSLSQGGVYVSSGHVRPGHRGGGRLHARDGEVFYDPTVQQRPVRVSRLTRTTAALAEPGGAREPHHVSDFSTLPDLVKHAQAEGATHAIHGRKTWGDPAEAYLYFPRGDGSYEEAAVYRERGYLHVPAETARGVVSSLPSNAEPIGRPAGSGPSRRRHASLDEVGGKAAEPRTVAARREIEHELWLCQDCMIAEVNGDVSGLDDERAEEVQSGIERLVEQVGPLSANFQDGDGEEEFSRRSCDACGSRDAGAKYRFASFGKQARETREAPRAEPKKVHPNEPGQAGLYRYGTHTIWISSPGKGTWWATVRNRSRSKDKDFTARTFDEVMTIATQWIDSASGHPREARESHSVRDYIAVNRDDKVIAGPFKSHDEAGKHVPAGGYVKFTSGHLRRRTPPAPFPALHEESATEFKHLLNGTRFKFADQTPDGFGRETWTYVKTGHNTYRNPLSPQGKKYEHRIQNGNVRVIPEERDTHETEAGGRARSPKEEAGHREVAGKYLTKSGKVGVIIYRSHSRHHGMVFSYTGEWGAGSGISAKDMRDQVDEWLRQKRGVQIIIPFAQ